jgi:predicted Zn-dependent protease
MKIRLVLIALIVLCVTALGQRTQLKPGLNNYSPADDVKLGQQAAQEAEKSLTLINDRGVTTYIATLGQKLVSKAPDPNKFPFTFKVVNEKEINAFALPGGPVFVNRGAIEAADNEAQIAGVMGHEIAHVVLRHGTNQASKSDIAGGVAGVLGGLFGGRTGQLASAGGAFAANMTLLRYSRDAESQADLMGTQILYDLGYAPRAMAEFFDKLAKEHRGSSMEQWFSNHPIPENRVAKVNAEIKKLGPELPNPKIDTPEFQRVKKTLLALPDPKPKAKAAASAQGGAQSGQASGAAAAPALPSTRMTSFQSASLQLQHPDNWKAASSGTSVAIAPAGAANDRGDLGYGIVIDVFKPQNAKNLDEATTQFLDNLRKNNPNMKMTKSRVQTRVDSRPAQLTELTNDSPFGGAETDVVVTVLRSTSELQYFVQVAPTKDMPKYQQTFQSIMNSIRLK